MHCPTCGMKASSGQKFCRACGFGLDKVEQLIAEQAPDENISLAPDLNEERSKGWRHFWFTFFIVAFLTQIVFAVMTGRVSVFSTVGLIVFLLGILASGAYMEFRRESPSKQKSRQPPPSTDAPTTKKLMPQPGLEMNASVTEQTTANLAEKIEN